MEELIHEFLSSSDGYGDGSGYGSGDGSGYGSGDGSGYGSGYGDGDGSGSGSGSGLISYDGATVYMVDGVQTLISHVRGNVARGALVNGDLTTTPCYIVKQDDTFAHGATLHEAREALMEKLLDNMPLSERISAFVKEHTPGQNYPNTDFFSWHHRLTGSCEMGRRQFAKDRGIDVENGSMTPEEFVRLTENAYGGNVIRMLREYYPDK